MDDEAAMLAELEREIYASLPDPRAIAEELRAKINEEKQLAIQARDAGDTQTALKHLQAKKELDGELAVHLAQFPEADQPVQAAQ